jgi:ADP-ribosyl-[dinitrogen reductase] hydrolase
MNSMLGALVGDAAGATLEFYHSGEITEEIACNAMKMPGGGNIRVGSGQITDDGELTLTLWQALKDKSPEDGFPSISVINWYRDWYESIPFDMGSTCSQAFEFEEECSTEEELVEQKRRIYSVNWRSEANGALMRATAIPTWFAKSDLEAYIGAQYAIEDAKLSHPSSACQEVNAIYVYTIINLLRGITPTDALTYTDEFIKLNEFSDKVKNWYFTESLDISDMNAKHNMGHCRWAFVLAFYFLRHPEIDYENAILTTLMKGGDTDTNAAIVGGMVGAYHSIPDYMLKPVMEFDCTSGKGHIRPKVFGVKYVL